VASHSSSESQGTKKTSPAAAFTKSEKEKKTKKEAQRTSNWQFTPCQKKEGGFAGGPTKKKATSPSPIERKKEEKNQPFP